LSQKSLFKNPFAPKKSGASVQSAISDSATATPTDFEIMLIGPLFPIRIAHQLTPAWKQFLFCILVETSRKKIDREVLSSIP